MKRAEQQNLWDNPTFIRYAHCKQRLTWSLTLAMLAIYYGFVLLVAFAPQWLGSPIGQGVTSIGMLLGTAVIMLSFLLTGIYVRYTNKVLEPLNTKLQKELKA